MTDEKEEKPTRKPERGRVCFHPAAKSLFSKQMVDFISQRGASEVVFGALAWKRGHQSRFVSGAWASEPRGGTWDPECTDRITGDRALEATCWRGLVASLSLASLASDEGPSKPSRDEGPCQRKAVKRGAEWDQHAPAEGCPESGRGTPFFLAQRQTHNRRKMMQKSRIPDSGRPESRPVSSSTTE